MRVSQLFSRSCNIRSTHRLVVLAEGGMNDTAIEEYLGLVGDAIEASQGLFEFIVVVGTECLDPRLNFLVTVSSVPMGCHLTHLF